MKENWFTEWFDSPYYPMLYQNRNEQEAQDWIEKLMDLIALPKGKQVLDLACGRGRHSVFLDSLGYEVEGWDISPQSIADAKTHYPHLAQHFRVHDMRLPFPAQKFDVVLNLFTSFGYFKDINDNYQVLQNVKQALNPHGGMVLDFLNPTYIIQNLVPYEQKKIQDVYFTINKNIQNGFIQKKIKIEDNILNRKFSYQENVQCLFYSDFENIFSKIGFSIKEIWGNYEAETFNLQKSPRMVFYIQIK